MGGRHPFGIVTLSKYPKALRHAREIARQHGYAIGLHGSRLYDLDLIACPWADPCSTPEILATAIAEHLGWYLLMIQTKDTKEIRITKKPHGRLGFLIYGPQHAHIDLSVMPRGSHV